MTKRSSHLLLVVAIFIAGCTNTSLKDETWAGSSFNSDRPARVEIGGKVVDAFVRDGLLLLRKGDHESAAREFGKALRYDPQSSYLQFLNGLSYHLMAETSNPDRYESARIGYELALKFDPNNWLAASQLARLCLATRDYPQAQNCFAHALLFRPNDPGLLYGLARASYYLQDLETAFGASSKAVELSPGSREMVSAHAIIAAATGRTDAALQSLSAFRAMEPTGLRLAKLEERIDDWKALYSTPGKMASPLSSAEPEQPSRAADSSGNAVPEPRMVMIDVVMVRTEENETSNKGVNLLQELSLTYHSEYGNSQSRQGDVSNPTSQTFNTGLTLPQVNYSLNIFNAGDDRSEVLALPTLIALDGKPSSSFAGASMNVAVSGIQTGSISTIDAGITLEVLPTFLSENRLQLHILARRTYPEEAASGTFVQAVRTSRNEVTADVILDIGQTLVLSGLREKQTIGIKSGVPLLRDIPILQYLFSHETTMDFHKSLLILLTPRRVTGGLYRSPVAGENSDAGLTPTQQTKLQEFRQRYGYLFDLEPNISRVLKHLDKHEVAKGLRSADFFDSPWWGGTDSIDFILKRAASFLFY